MGDDQKLMKKRLKVLMNLPENQVCSDCTERQPRWASLIVPPPGAPPGSLPIGAFCCLECSGSHRRLGVHISFVRSINLDSWKEKEVLAMENGGNFKVNAIFEATLNEAKPTNHADLNTRERFIRDKYERRKFYDASVFERLAREAAAAPPPRAPQPKAPDADAFPEMSAAAREDFPAAQSGSVGAPSAAARRRLEARKIERSDTGSSTHARAAPRAAATAKAGHRSKSAASEPTDLLGFSEPEPQRGVGRSRSQDLMGFSDDEEKSSSAGRPKAARKKSMEMNTRKSKPNSTGDGEDEFDAIAPSSGSDFGDFGDFVSPGTAQQAEKKPAAPAKKSAQDIMSLYNASAAANPGLGANGMPMNNANMAIMAAKMQQINMQNANIQSAQQVQQQAIMYQQHMMRLQMQAQQQGIMGGLGVNPMAGGMMMNGGLGGGPAMTLPSLQQTRPASTTSDGKPVTGMGLASMHSVGSAASGNGGESDPFSSLTGRQGFR